MRYCRLFVVVGMFAILFTAAPAGASTVTFDFGSTADGYVGGSTIGGFQFTGDWFASTHGQSPNYAYMSNYYNTYCITFQPGTQDTFTFNSITLNGRPFDDYWNPPSGTLNVSFLGINGNLITQTAIHFSSATDPWVTLTTNVSGVRTIEFTYSIASGEVGVWARVGTMNYNAVPIPGAVWLLGSGFIGLIGLKRRIFS
jgi:hypothetical protein